MPWIGGKDEGLSWPEQPLTNGHTNGYTNGHTNRLSGHVNFPDDREEAHYDGSDAVRVAVANPMPDLPARGIMFIHRAVSLATSDLFRNAGEERPSTDGHRQLQQGRINRLMDPSAMSGAERNQFEQCLQAYGWR